ncbi:MAG TPA: hypothetical protein VMH32_13075 [Burkholderiales bacterium]|nr:hypothetical protein [Burkholderiales bacterium]
MKGLRVISAFALALTGCGMALAIESVVTGQSNGIPYATGGVGLESRELLRAKESEFNLAVVLSLKDGQYLGGGKVSVRAAGGKTLLAVEAQGPWVLARLAPGKYVVEATLAGIARSRNVTIGKAGMKRVYLTWDREAS